MFTLDEARVTIVGLGLMGGSLALALRPHVAHLTAIDLDEMTLANAEARGMVDVGTTDLGSGVRDADLVVLATPVGGILHVLQVLPELRTDGCLVLDLGSTKGDICRAMDQLPPAFAAMGGHPMCGKESSGLEAAEGTLFRAQTFILCRTARTNPHIESLALTLLQRLQAVPLFLEPEEHDRLVALISHLPYFVASLLIQQATIGASQNALLWQISASGFRDTTRLAGSDPRMLADVVRTNRPAILACLQAYRDNLDALIALLEHADDQALHAWLMERQHEHRVYRQNK